MDLPILSTKKILILAPKDYWRANSTGKDSKSGGDFVRHHFYLDRATDVIDIPDWDDLSSEQRIRKCNIASLIILLEPGSNTTAERMLSNLRENNFRRAIFLCYQLPDNKPFDIPILGTPLVFQYDLTTSKFLDSDQLRLKETISLGEAAFTLSKSLLADVNYYAIDRVGRGHELLHNLNLNLNNAFSGPKPTTSTISKWLGKYLESEIRPLLVSDQFARFELLRSEILTAVAGLKNPSIAMVSEIILRRKTDIYGLLSREDENLARENTVEWGVVIVDDEESVRKEIKEILSPNLKVFSFATVGEAIRFLQQDTIDDGKGGFHKSMDFIKVLITDWRFLTTSTTNGRTITHWQALQGYDLVEWVQEKLGLTIACFVLTAKTGGVIRKARDANETGISWYAKHHVLGKQASDQSEFLARVRERGEICYYQSHAGPAMIASWRKGIAPAYLAFKQSEYRTQIEQRVQDTSESFIRFFSEQEVEIASKLEEGITLFTPFYPIPLPNLAGRLGKGSMNFQKLTDFDDFIAKMAARRVFMWLKSMTFGEDEVMNDFQISLFLRCGVITDRPTFFNLVSKDFIDKGAHKADLLRRKTKASLNELVTKHLAFGAARKSTLGVITPVDHFSRVDQQYLTAEEKIWMAGFSRS
jgi:CheY-like chemotaxis protein